MGTIGNQESRTLKAPSIRPESIPAPEVVKPPEAVTFEKPLITLLPNINKKT